MIFFHLKRELSADYTDYADFSTVGSDRVLLAAGFWPLTPPSDERDSSLPFQNNRVNRKVTATALPRLGFAPGVGI
jgi:hypothetical protein